MSTKITKVFSTAFIIFIVFFSLILVSSKQEALLINIFESNFYTSIYIPESTKIPKTKLIEILSSAQKDQVYFSQYKDNVNYVSIQDFNQDVDYFLGEKIPDGTTSLSTFDLEVDHNFYVKPLQFGTTDNLKLTFKKMDESSLNDEEYGFFNLYAQDQESANTYLYKISQLIGIDQEEFIQQKSISNDADFFNVFILTGIIIFSISNMLVILFGFIKRNKEIGIYKMLGLSDLSVAKIGLSDYMKWFIMCSIITIIATSLITNYWSIYLIKTQIKYLGVFFIVSILLIVISSTIITRKYNIASLTKNQKTTNSIIRFSMIAKLLFVIVLSFFLVNTTSMLDSLIKDQHKLRIYENYSDTYALTSYVKNFSNIDESNHRRVPRGYPDFNYLDFYQNVVVKNNGLYADFSAYQSEINRDEQYSFALVNDTYIQDYESIPLNKIKEALKEKKRVLLIPDEFDDVKEDIYNDYKVYFQSSKTMTSDLPMEIITYKQGDFFTMNTAVTGKNYLIHNPIIIVFDENTIEGIPEFQMRFLGYGSGTAAQFILEDNETKEMWYEKNKPTFKTLNIEKNIPLNAFNNTSNDLVVMISVLKASIKIFSVILVIAILLIGFVSFNMTYTYMNDMRKEIFVRKLFGEPDTKIFKKYILILIFTDLLAIIMVLTALPVFLNTPIDTIGLASIIVTILLIETLMFYAVKSSIYKSNMNHQIKGE
ncbi:DUF1430 domain-containing protein [Erysipelothrix urinaevulpis]|uniref:DUF1430 domain-containing protein n=1 Tax=Erysipelothrix urinaevulpis TaxID=2683717 RepID=UPI00135A0A25|nr:DUF1430 domain-containing protein [Erysipelothrix urinaevulpis]